jgi:hypothetical protein
MIDVEGYTAEEPVSDEDWWDEVRWQVSYHHSVRHDGHNRDGYFAEIAGSEKCLALGHRPDPELGWETDDLYDSHPYGWHGDQLCTATKYGTACTECESDDCPWEPADPEILWGKVRG